MVDRVPENILKNCTNEVIALHPELSTLNESDILILNRSFVLQTLSDIYSQHSKLYLDKDLQLSFKWVASDPFRILIIICFRYLDGEFI